MTQEDKIWAILKKIDDAFALAPEGKPLLVDSVELEKEMKREEHEQLLEKFQSDFGSITISKKPDYAKNFFYKLTIPDQSKYQAFVKTAHAKYIGRIEIISGNNFLAIADVILDISHGLELTMNDDVIIPLLPSVVRFPNLFPADTIPVRDRYCDFRRNALAYLKENEYIQDCRLDDTFSLHRWQYNIIVTIDRMRFDKFYERFVPVYEKRVIFDADKDKKKEENEPPVKEATQSDKLPQPPFTIAITSMPDLNVRHIEDAPIAKGSKRVHLPHFSPTQWAKVTIRFIDEQNVIITADKKQAPSDYEALGFADGKRGKPNTAWVFLLALARNNGETKQLPTPIPDPLKQQKRQLADRLKTIFKNDTDPFFDAADTRTYKLKITLLPPNGEDTPDKFGVREYLTDTMTEEYEE